MADEKKFTFENSGLPTRSYEYFKTVRNDIELCDVILRVGNQSISTHRLILAAAFPYFRKSFARNVSETDFPDIDRSAFENLLDYAYTCEIVITEGNVKNLLYGACCLHAEEIQEACCKFLIDTLIPENVLNVRNFANELKLTKLVEYIDIYVRENFADVSKTEEFLNFSSTYIFQLFESNELRVASEEEVFEAAMKWVSKSSEQRKANLPELMKTVRMPLLSPLYLKKHVAKEVLIRASIPCRELLDEVRDFHDFPEERSVCSFSTVPRYSFPIVPRCSLETTGNVAAINKERIYTVYGKLLFTVKDLENTRTIWEKKSSSTFCCSGTSTAVLRGKLYLLRGDDIFSYEPKSNIFSYCTFIRYGRMFTGIAQFFDKIYICGGKDYSSASKTIMCFDPAMNKVEKIANMLECRQDPGISTLGKCIYVAGGRNNTVVHKSVEKYDIPSGRWSFVSPMLHERFGQGFTALNGQLYACGGINSKLKCIRSAEVYDPVKNKWFFVSPMNSARCRFKLLQYCGELYAIGGYDCKLKQLGIVEIYDPKNDKWRFGDSIQADLFISAEVLPSSPLV